MQREAVARCLLSAGALAAGLTFAVAARAQQAGSTGGPDAVAQPSTSAAAPVGASATDQATSANTLPAITVTSQADKEAEAVNPPTTVGSKTPLAQREIAQTVTVIPQEQIQQQNMRTLDDAMQSAPGVSVSRGDSERSTYYSRGFPITSWMLDGVPTNQNLTSTGPNLAMYDRVEVLQGPDALMSGFGSAGGALNLVRKRAPTTFSMNAELFGGTYNDFGGTVDVGGPINKAGTLRGRVVGNIENQDLMEDTTWRHDKLIYGTLEADLTPTTQLRVGASYSAMSQKFSWTGDMGYDYPVNGVYPLYGNRSTYFGTPWDHNDFYTTNAFAELDQKLGSGWSGKLAFNYQRTDYHVLYEGSNGIENDTGLTDVVASKAEEVDSQKSIDAFVTGPVHLLGRTHNLTFGATYLHEDFATTSYECGPDDVGGIGHCTGLQQPFSWLSSAPEPAFNGPVDYYSRVINQYGLYGNTRISLADPLTLVLGARAIWWNTSAQGDVTDSSHSAKVTPYAGLIYDINRNYSAYVSYSTIYQPQAAIDAEARELPPLQGTQYEAGIKGEYFGGKLNTSLTIFQLTEENRAISDPRYPGENYYLASARARSRGVELNATGHLTDNWTLFGGYTYTNAQYLDGATGADNYANGTGTVAFQSIAPKNLFKLWTNYQLPGKFHQVSVGGGAYFSSGIWGTDGTGGYLRQGSVVTFDLRAAYQINKQLSAAVNVTNLFDRHYLASLAGPYTGFYGNPRQVIFSLRMSL